MLWLSATGETVDLQAAAGDDGDSLPTFTGTAYTGGTMRPMHFYRDVVVDLSGAKVAPKDRPIHRDHRTDQIVGHSPAGDIKIAAKSIKVKGIISGTGKHAQEVIANGKNKFPWQLSIGARIERIEWVDEDATVTVNGRRFKGGIYVVRACTIFEISFVSLGGDDNTSARVAATAEGYAMNFTQWLAARGHDINSLTAQNLATLRAQFETESGQPAATPTTPPAGQTTPAAGISAGAGISPSPAPAGRTDPAAGALLAGGTPAPPTPEQLNAQRLQLEREANQREASRLELSAARESICARFGSPKIKVGEGDNAQEVDLLVHATREGWSANETELHARRNSRPDGVTISSPSRDVNARGLEAALCMTAGCDADALANDYNEREMNCAMDRSYRGAGLKQLFATRAAIAGHSQSAGQFNNDTIEAALQADQRDQLLANSSTFSTPGILSNVMNKSMQKAYSAIEDILSLICSWGPVTDFKEQTHYQLTVDGDWSEVANDGQLKHGELKESKYTNSAKTRGMMIGLTRKHIRNDDLRAFLRIPMGIARKSANAKQRIGFAVLLQMITDGDFSAENANLVSGASSVLGIDGLQLAVNLFKKMKDETGEEIGVRPALLLTGTTLSVVAEDLYKQTNIDVRRGTKKEVLRNNHANKYQPADSPYLDTEYGGTDTGYFLCADKNDIPILDGVALDGRMVPYVQRGDANFNTLGIEFRAFDDWGVGKGNPRGAVHSTGS